MAATCVTKPPLNRLTSQSTALSVPDVAHQGHLERRRRDAPAGDGAPAALASRSAGRTPQRRRPVTTEDGADWKSAQQERSLERGSCCGPAPFSPAGPVFRKSARTCRVPRPPSSRRAVRRPRHDRSLDDKVRRRGRRRGEVSANRSPTGSGRRGSNPRPQAWEARALPAELRPRFGGQCTPAQDGRAASASRSLPVRAALENGFSSTNEVPSAARPSTVSSA